MFLTRISGYSFIPTCILHRTLLPLFSVTLRHRVDFYPNSQYFSCSAIVQPLEEGATGCSPLLLFLLVTRNSFQPCSWKDWSNQEATGWPLPPLEIPALFSLFFFFRRKYIALTLDPPLPTAALAHRYILFFYL